MEPLLVAESKDATSLELILFERKKSAESTSITIRPRYFLLLQDDGFMMTS